MLTKSTLAAAGLGPGDLARLTGRHPTTVSRLLSAPGSKGHVNADGATLALVYAWWHLPEDVRAALLRGDHLQKSTS